MIKAELKLLNNVKIVEWKHQHKALNLAGKNLIDSHEHLISFPLPFI
jgi:hypothetical protein